MMFRTSKWHRRQAAACEAAAKKADEEGDTYHGHCLRDDAVKYRRLARRKEFGVP